MHRAHSSPSAAYQVEKEYHSSSRSFHVHVQEAAHQAHQVLPVHQEHRALVQVDHPYTQLASLDTHEVVHGVVVVVVAAAAAGNVVAAVAAAVGVAAGSEAVNPVFHALQGLVHQKKKA